MFNRAWRNLYRFVRLLLRNTVGALSQKCEPRVGYLSVMSQHVRCLPGRHKPKCVGTAREVWYWNFLLPEDKYLNVICMWKFTRGGNHGFCMWAMRQWRHCRTFLSGQHLSLLLILLLALTEDSRVGVGCVYTVLCSVKPVHNQIRIFISTPQEMLQKHMEKSHGLSNLKV